MAEPLTDEQLHAMRKAFSARNTTGNWVRLLDEHAALKRERVLLIDAVAASTAIYDAHGDRSSMWLRLRGALDAWLRFDAEREGKV